jgi:hypothetical protein
MVTMDGWRPVLNKKAGDQTDFQDPYLFNMQMHALA